MTPSVKTNRKHSIRRNLYSLYNSYVIFGIDHEIDNMEITYNVDCGTEDNEVRTAFLRLAAQKLLEEAAKIEAK
jgi:hypothetical protein